MAGLDDEDDGYRAKRKEALGQFVLAPFRPLNNDPQPDFTKMAHNFFELVSLFCFIIMSDLVDRYALVLGFLAVRKWNHL
jgi:hypothetical protein